MTDKFLNNQIKDKPKICAIDLEQEIVEALQAKGLQCFLGTLGYQVKVPNSLSRRKHECLLNYNFPDNLHEYDIIIVDLREKTPKKYTESEHTHTSVKGSEKLVFLSHYPETIFDPRPIASSFLKDDLRDFYKKETIIVIFCSADEPIKYYPRSITPNNCSDLEPQEYCLYEFISNFPDNFNKTGENIRVTEIEKNFKSLKCFLQKYSKKFTYEIVFKHPRHWVQDKYDYVYEENFIPLLVNSNNEIVGFVDLSFYSSALFAFPQLKEGKKDFVLELINKLLPEGFPKIFPYSEQFAWLNSEIYYLPNQANLLEEKVKLEEDYQNALSNWAEKFNNNKNQYLFLHNLIRETGDSLVKSVKFFLCWLGFENIINMDETNPKLKEEDLQIFLDKGLLIVEIKGLCGTSTDSDCSQINKIKNRRMKERKSFDVFALYIVNHQRYLPPIARDNPSFNEQQIADAQSDERGLLTTYQLFKLYFYIEQGFITKEDVRSSLLDIGLVQFQPSNALCIGYPLEIHYQGQVVILYIKNLTLHQGSSIIVCDNDCWFKADILEIQLNSKNVKSASNGEIGIKLSNSVNKTSQLWLKNLNS